MMCALSALHLFLNTRCFHHYKTMQVDALAEEIMGRVLPEGPMPAEASAGAEMF
jgi:hypothetical protein